MKGRKAKTGSTLHKRWRTIQSPAQSQHHVRSPSHEPSKSRPTSVAHVWWRAGGCPVRVLLIHVSLLRSAAGVTAFLPSCPHLRRISTFLKCLSFRRLRLEFIDLERLFYQPRDVFPRTQIWAAQVPTGSFGWNKTASSFFHKECPPGTALSSVSRLSAGLRDFLTGSSEMTGQHGPQNIFLMV